MAVERRIVSSGSPYEPVVGYSRAVRVGDRVFVAGSAPIMADGSDPPADAYGQGRIFADGVVPRRLVTTSPHFHRQVVGMTTQDGARIVISGVDLIRDENGRFRGLSNLWITDGSALPRSAGVNPSLTIAANALRVGAALS